MTSATSFWERICNTHKNAAAQMRIYLGSLKPLKSTADDNDILPSNGSLVRIVKHDTDRHVSVTKPAIRIAQGNPVLRMRFWNISG